MGTTRTPVDSMNLAGDKRSNFLWIGFNQDYGCFSCGTENGFHVYNTDPLKERFRREFESGGIGIVEILFRCNILALVGGGKNPKYAPNKVMIWDDYQNKCIVELECRSEVRGVRLRRDRIVVVMDDQIFVYNFADLQMQVLRQVKTIYNPKGLCGLSSGANTVLACPATEMGHVYIELFDINKVHEIQAHTGPLSQICLSMDGKMLATASVKGTLIRVFDTASGKKLFEFRRGANQAEIYSLAFSKNLKYLCCCSEKGTGHVFSLLQSEDEQRNRQSSLSFMKGVLPSYFSSEWSFAQFHLETDGSRSICCFGQDSENSVIVVNSEGIYYKFEFDETNGGEARRVATGRFPKKNED